MDWYPKDVIAYRLDTRHLTTLEDGAYNLLIDEYMITRQPLPDDDRALARIAKMNMSDWLVMAPTIRAFFKGRGGVLTLKKCDAILNAQDNSSKRLSENAKKAAVIRWAAIKALDAAGMQPAQSTYADGVLGDARERETLREDPVAKATDAVASQAAPKIDPPPPPENGHAVDDLSEQDLVWKDGLQWLARAEGKSESALRSMVGRWCKIYGAAHVLGAMTEVRSQSPPIVGPVAWIEATLAQRNRGNGTGRGHKGEQPIRNGFIGLALEAQRRAEEGD